MWICSFPVSICWRNCPFPIEWSWHSCQRLFDHTQESLFLASLYSFIGVFVFMPLSHCFDYCGFVICFETYLEVWVFQRCSFSKLFWLFEVPWDSLRILEWFFLFLQKILFRFWEGLHWICKSLWVVWTYYILTLPVYEQIPFQMSSLISFSNIL